MPFATVSNTDNGFLPYLRDFETFSRPWAIPGTPGLEHRLGGLEKEANTGNVSYDPSNHQLMTDTRAWKVANIANDIPPVEVDRAGESDGELLVLGWGSTYGSIKAAVRRVRGRGAAVDQAHLRHLNPFPANLGQVLGRYRRILVPELNSGHLLRLVRADFLVPAIGLNKVAGEPFHITEIESKIEQMLEQAP